MIRFVEEVFVTEGVPNFTFVAPPNFNDILLDIRRPGKPVIIEGQSGTGKTTSIKKIIEKLGHTNVFYLSARDSTHISKIEEIIRTPEQKTFVIDDFHRLAEDTQLKLVEIAKISAEQTSASTPLPKLILIGINQLGSSLIQLVPDVAKRMGIHQISPGTKDDINQLVNSGCGELNISIKNSELVFEECRGDYWLAQQLCQQICIINDILETKNEVVEIDFNIPVLREKVVTKLKAAYYAAVKEFCRGQRFRPSNDPYYKLLSVISKQANSIVDLNELANANPEFRGSINNIKERRLVVLLQSKPECSKYFYYNPETKNFAVEDPALFYFLKHLNWEELRSDCGFRASSKDYEWDVAISFAGENRELARTIAENLEILDLSVFFDESYEANMLGKALSATFEKIFVKDSRTIICLLDVHHKNKIWPTFERQCFQPRVGEGEVIPIFLDATNFPEVASEIFGIRFQWDSTKAEWKEKVIDSIVLKIGEHLETLQ